MAGPDIGVKVTCPSCGRESFQKAMIPLMGQGGPGTVSYVCPDCARRLVDTAATAAEAADADTVAAAEAADADAAPTSA